MTAVKQLADCDDTDRPVLVADERFDYTVEQGSSRLGRLELDGPCGLREPLVVGDHYSEC